MCSGSAKQTADDAAISVTSALRKAIRSAAVDVYGALQFIKAEGVGQFIPRSLATSRSLRKMIKFGWEGRNLSAWPRLECGTTDVARDFQMPAAASGKFLGKLRQTSGRLKNSRGSVGGRRLLTYELGRQLHC